MRTRNPNGPTAQVRPHRRLGAGDACPSRRRNLPARSRPPSSGLPLAPLGCGLSLRVHVLIVLVPSSKSRSVSSEWSPLEMLRLLHCRETGSVHCSSLAWSHGVGKCTPAIGPDSPAPRSSAAPPGSSGGTLGAPHAQSSAQRWPAIAPKCPAIGIGRGAINDDNRRVSSRWSLVRRFPPVT